MQLEDIHQKEQSRKKKNPLQFEWRIISRKDIHVKMLNEKTANEREIKLISRHAQQIPESGCICVRGQGQSGRKKKLFP